MTDQLPPPGLPQRKSVDVWQLDLDALLGLLARIEGVLSAEEQSRAKRFVHEKDALRYRLCRSLLRLALGRYLACGPGRIELTTRWRGKPCLAGNSLLHFNVSHAGGVALFAFTTVGEVGIDVERVQREIDALELASTYFTRGEAAMIAAAANREERAMTFATLWTRKEAVLKALGCGLYQPLNTLDVSSPGIHEVAMAPETDSMAQGRWRLKDIDVVEGYAGAVAAPAEDWAIRKWVLDEPLMRTMFVPA